MADALALHKLKLWTRETGRRARRARAQTALALTEVTLSRAQRSDARGVRRGACGENQG